ncbi:MAG TPA: hypothetical protein VHE35_00555 [Kofleriaceae bacterium]|nr:hypothetical protein [Kofleriaceae bacterium]
MKPTERQLCQDLLVTPPRGQRKISKERFAALFPSCLEEGGLSGRVLDGAVHQQDADELQCAMIVGHTFGFRRDHLKTLEGNHTRIRGLSQRGRGYRDPGNLVAGAPSTRRPSGRSRGNVAL